MFPSPYGVKCLNQRGCPVMDGKRGFPSPYGVKCLNLDLIFSVPTCCNKFPSPYGVKCLNRYL